MRPLVAPSAVSHFVIKELELLTVAFFVASATRSAINVPHDFTCCTGSAAQVCRIASGPERVLT